MAALLHLQCEMCGKEISRYQSAVKRRVFCSKACGDAGKVKGTPTTCANCGKTFMVTPSQIREGRGVYCSRECKGTSQDVQCKTCGKPFRIASNAVRAGGNFCSKQCHYKAHGREPIPNTDGTVTIPLTRGYVAIVDAADLPLVEHVSWAAFPHRRTVYAKGRLRNRAVMMHQLVAKTPPGLVTDHIDGDGLNNTRANLRQVSNSENLRNSYKHRQRKAHA